jgi:WD40 repeat protein
MCTALRAAGVLLVFTASFTAPFLLATEPPQEASASRDKSPGTLAQNSDDAGRVLKGLGILESFAWSPDSMTLAILDKSPKIQLWNVNEARLKRVLPVTDHVIFSVEFSPDRKTLACAAWPQSGMGFEKDGPRTSEVLLWDVVSGALTRRLEIVTKDELGLPMSFDLLKIAFSPDGKKLAGCGKLVAMSDRHGIGTHIGGEVCLWDLESGTLKWRRRGLHTDIVYDVAFSPDGRLLASGGLDKLIRLLDPETGDLKRTLYGAGWDGVEAISWSHDSALLASTGFGREEGGNSRLWEVSSGRLLKTFGSAAGEKSIIRTFFSPVDDEALFGLVPEEKKGEGWSWQVRRWTRRGEHVDNVTSKHMGTPRLMRVSPDGKKIAVGTYKGNENAVVICDVSPRVAPDR